MAKRTTREKEEQVNFATRQLLPLALTILVCLLLVGALYLEISLLNMTAISRDHISVEFRWTDILVGLTIYLKTSIDFALFMGNLMAKYPGWKNRVMIEIGTALGNALGTMGILLVWDFFREVRWLMAIMIVIAALVLFRLAEEGLDHAKDAHGKFAVHLFGFPQVFARALSRVNALVGPVVNVIVPKTSLGTKARLGFAGLFFFALTIPFILGLDDFAGYLPLFNIVNVFGFATGVFFGHMVLNIFLFLSPSRTIAVVKNAWISFAGSIAFVGLALWGFVEAARLLGAPL
jgi:hypothetical protein